jgi:phosphoglycerate kinase
MSLQKKSLTDLSDSQLAGQRVLVRMDLNVPFNPDGSIASDYRIRQCLPTIEYLLARHAKVIIATHLGRPNKGPDPKFSVLPVFKALNALLPQAHFQFIPQVVGAEVQEAIALLPSTGGVLMIENVRFELGETKNDPQLAKQFASLCDIYVNEAFGSSHRAHASTQGLTQYLENNVAGLLMQKELSALAQIVETPKRPFVAIVGGSKISTKLQVLKNLLGKVDTLIVGGGMVYTFLKAQGLEIGTSIVEDDFLEAAREVMTLAKSSTTTLLLPTDIVVSDAFSNTASHKTVSIQDIPTDWMGMDTGAQSVEAIQQVLHKAKTVFWNGPVGVFEFETFSTGTRAIAETLVKLTHEAGLISVLGGGDTQSAIQQFKLPTEAFTHVSTGGGATMELIEGIELPGIAALSPIMPVLA